MNLNKGLFARIHFSVQHYNPKKYWKRRSIVVNPNSKVPKLIRLYYLYYLKRCDAFNCASIGTDLGKGAFFKTIPNLEHGLKGIVIHQMSVIGANVTIFQQVTIGVRNNSGAPVIGDNVIFGAGARLLGDIKIGNNVKIGANAVVVKDVPDNCTVVGVPARIISTKNHK